MQIKRKALFAVCSLIFSSVASANMKKCYDVFSDDVESVPVEASDRLCLVTNDVGVTHITLETGVDHNTVAEFHYRLQPSEAPAVWNVNKKVYSIATPSNSSFKKLEIRFDGKRSIVTPNADNPSSPRVIETGKIYIGQTELSYSARY